MAILTTKRQAAMFLRRESGKSVEWCETQVKQLAMHKDGTRLKVKTADLNALLNSLRERDAHLVTTLDIRPISKAKKERLRQRCL